MKTKILSYFRYHHFSTHPAKQSHSHFISMLNSLEYLSDKNVEGVNQNDTWVKIKEAINVLSLEDIKLLLFKIRNNR